MILKKSNPMNEQNKFYIQYCFDLAQKGKGKVSPNPLVGAVIVKGNRIISEGWHDHYGAPHAEAMAINEAKESLEKATLYCNLEPCCHTNKKTPPCLPHVINSGIKRVVLSNSDPNPQVAGKSIKQMRKAGIEVIENVIATPHIGAQTHEANRNNTSIVCDKIISFFNN